MLKNGLSGEPVVTPAHSSTPELASVVTGTGIGVGDYDRDGALDLYVCGYVRYEEQSAGSRSQFGVEIPVSINPAAFEPHENLLLRGHGA